MLGNPKQSWILDSTPWIPDSQVLDYGFFVSANWIPDPNRCWIPESLSCIPDSSAQDLGFHSKKLAGFRNPDSLTRGGKMARFGLQAV